MRRPLRLASAGVALLSVALAVGASWDDSATTDEPYHLLAARAHVSEGLYDLNPDKPPLVKLLSGAALAALGTTGSAWPPVERLRHLPEETRRFLYGNVVPAETILRTARLPLVVFLLALLWGVHAWARELFGEEAALLSVVAVGLQPLVLGHALLVQTDLASAATWTWTLLWLHRRLRGRAKGFLGFGACLGLALLAKFSALHLLLISLLLVLLEARRRRSLRLLVPFAAALGLALAVVAAGYGAAMRNTSPSQREATIRLQAAQWPGTAATAERLVVLSRVAPAAAHYGLGLLHLVETNRHGQGINYFLGRTSRDGFLLYFPVAFVLKVSLPFLVLLGWGFLDRRRSGLDRDDAVLLLPFALVLLASLGSTYNIGARHLLPALPPLAVFGAAAARSSPPLAWRSLAGAFGLSALLAFPHYVSHFSLLGGGAEAGRRLLQDSNLDWGQDWARLGRAAEGAGWAPLVTVSVGTAFPSYYLPGSRDYVLEGLGPAPGTYAVSSFAASVGAKYLELLGAGPDAARLRSLLAALEARGKRVGGAGTSLDVYRLGREEAERGAIIPASPR